MKIKPIDPKYNVYYYKRMSTIEGFKPRLKKINYILYPNYRMFHIIDNKKVVGYFISCVFLNSKKINLGFVLELRNIGKGIITKKLFDRYIKYMNNVYKGKRMFIAYSNKHSLYHIQSCKILEKSGIKVYDKNKTIYKLLGDKTDEKRNERAAADGTKFDIA